MNTRCSRPSRLPLLALLVLVVLLLLPAQAFATEGANGLFRVQVLNGDTWTSVGELAFGLHYSTQTLTIPTAGTVRLVQVGGSAAQIDSASLDLSAPSGVSGSDDPLALAKLVALDDDVTGAFGRALTLSFPTAGTRLELTARVQGDISAYYPFVYPLVNTMRPVSADSSFYHYDVTAGPNRIDRTTAPFATIFTRPSTGHPDANTYVWVAADANALQVTLEFTSDNTTDDDQDYAIVHVKTADAVRDFRVSTVETDWGSVAFTYTDKAVYQHKVYSFAIPWSAIGGEADSVGLCFTAYGTASVITPHPTPVYRFYNAVTGTHFYTTGDTERANVAAHPEWGYAYEGVAYVLNDTHPVMTRPVHRFYNTRTRSHFYTASDQEKATVDAHPEWGYTYEGIAFYVSSDDNAPWMVYRFLNRLNGTHFYTASAEEKDAVSAQLAQVYTYEGIAFHYVAFNAPPN